MQFSIRLVRIYKLSSYHEIIHEIKLETKHQNTRPSLQYCNEQNNVIQYECREQDLRSHNTNTESYPSVSSHIN